MNAPTIGTRYVDRNKRVCTVTDIRQTYNSALTWLERMREGK